MECRVAKVLLVIMAAALALSLPGCAWARPIAKDTEIDVVEVKNITAFGAAGKTRSLVWYNDPDFAAQLTSNSPLYLVDQNKTSCGPGCGACQTAWKATPEELTVALFFKDPMLVTRINIKQIKNSGVVKVQLLKWVYPPTGAVEDNLGRTVWSGNAASTMCQSVLPVRIGPKKSGITLEAPMGASQEALPPKLAKVAVGGVLITTKRPAGVDTNWGPFIEYVRFDGAVLYPKDASIYSA